MLDGNLVEVTETHRTTHCWLSLLIQDLQMMQYGCNARNKWQKTDSLTLSQGLSCQDLKHPAPAIISPPRAQASSRLLLRPRQPDAEDDDSADEARLAWKAWMKPGFWTEPTVSVSVTDQNISVWFTA